MQKAITTARSNSRSEPQAFARARRRLTCFFFDLWLNEIREALAKGNYQPRTLRARKGDVFIWHANLVHGGSPVRQKDRSRKSLVAHYLTRAVQLYLV